MDIVNNQPMDLTKYREASTIVDLALTRVVMEACHAGNLVRDICLFGDSIMIECLDKIYTKQPQLEKGVSMPCCVNINNAHSYYSSSELDSLRLKEGDIVKVELGVHIDGYVAECAKTVVVHAPCNHDHNADSDEGHSHSHEPLEGKRADIICASYLASEVVLRMLQPGATSQQLRQAISECAAAFEVKAVTGISCALAKRFVTNHPQKCLVTLAKDAPKDPHADKSEFVVEENDVFIVSIGMSTGSGEIYPKSNSRPLCYVRNVDNKVNLKLQSARVAFELITAESSVFPFTIRDLDSRTRLGLQECVQKQLFNALPVMQDKNKEFTALFKYTCVVQSSGHAALRLTEPPVPVPYVSSDFGLPQHLQDIMEKIPVKKIQNRAMADKFIANTASFMDDDIIEDDAVMQE